MFFNFVLPCMFQWCSKRSFLTIFCWRSVGDIGNRSMFGEKIFNGSVERFVVRDGIVGQNIKTVVFWNITRFFLLLLFLLPRYFFLLQNGVGRNNLVKVIGDGSIIGGKIFDGRGIV